MFGHITRTHMSIHVEGIFLFQYMYFIKYREIQFHDDSWPTIVITFNGFTNLFQLFKYNCIMIFHCLYVEFAWKVNI